MAEYIEREAATKCLTQDGFIIDDYDDKWQCADSWISQVPSADVVSASVVEEMQKEIDVNNDALRELHSAWEKATNNWEQLKSTIIELEENNDGECHRIAHFLHNLMQVIETDEEWNI